MMWTCFQNTSGTSVSPTGPEVEPHVTGRPPPLSEPNRVLPGGRAHVLEDDVDAALVGGVKDRLRPLGIRRVVDAERRQDKGPVSGTSVLGTTRRPLPAPRTARTNSVSSEFLPERSVGPEAWARPQHAQRTDLGDRRVLVSSGPGRRRP